MPALVFASRVPHLLRVGPGCTSPSNWPCLCVVDPALRKNSVRLASWGSPRNCHTSDCFLLARMPSVIASLCLLRFSAQNEVTTPMPFLISHNLKSSAKPVPRRLWRASASKARAPPGRRMDLWTMVCRCCRCRRRQARRWCGSLLFNSVDHRLTLNNYAAIRHHARRPQQPHRLGRYHLEWVHERRLQELSPCLAGTVFLRSIGNRTRTSILVPLRARKPRGTSECLRHPAPQPEYIPSGLSSGPLLPSDATSTLPRRHRLRKTAPPASPAAPICRATIPALRGAHGHNGRPPAPGLSVPPRRGKAGEPLDARCALQR